MLDPMNIVVWMCLWALCALGTAVLYLLVHPMLVVAVATLNYFNLHKITLWCRELAIWIEFTVLGIAFLFGVIAFFPIIVPFTIIHMISKGARSLRELDLSWMSRVLPHKSQ